MPLARRVTNTPRGEIKRGEVHRGCVTIDVGVGSDDHLGDRWASILRGSQTPEEFRDPQILRADAFDRRQSALEHVIQTLVLARSLDRDDVGRVLHDTDDRGIAPGRAAVLTQFLIRHVEALLAEANLIFGLHDRVRQAFGIFGARLK